MKKLFLRALPSAHAESANTTSAGLMVAVAALSILSFAAYAQPAQTAASTPVAAVSKVTPPVAQKRPKDVTVHGDTRIDDYFYLRDKNDPAVIDYLKAENAYADAHFAPLKGFTDKLYAEMLARIKQTDQSVPYRNGQYWYNSQTIEGKQYGIVVRRKALGANRAYDDKGKDEVLLDINELAKGKKFMSVGTLTISPNEKLIAYATDETGARDFKLVAKDIATGKDQGLLVGKTAGAVWANDNKTIFYVTTNEAKRSNKIWRHVLGSGKPDQLVFEEKDELFDISIGKTLDERYIVIGGGSKDTTYYLTIDANAPASAARMLLPRKDGLRYEFAHRNGELFVILNDKGPNMRMVQVAMPKSGVVDFSKAKELVPHRPSVMLEGVTAFKQHMVLHERDNGSLKLRVFDFKAKADHTIAFDEQAYTAGPGQNAEFDTDTLRFNYTSLTTPSSVFDYNMNTRERQLKKQQPVLGTFDSKNYQSARIMATAKDGTKVPISLVWRKDMRRNGPQPMLLYAYGSYGNPMDPTFSSARLSYLDRGVIYAIAHIRGGGDLGRTWYEAGKMQNKMNTFTDFVASADELIKQGYTQPSQLAIMGGSAGGLLMGAVTNLRPDMFKAVVSLVPFVDVINTMLDESLPLTTSEFIEWGNPKIKEQYDWIRAYSPYDNLKPVAYPAIYMRTGLNDSQVPYWEPAKYAAKVRALRTNDAPLFFHTNMDVGHGGASGRYDALREQSKIMTFVLDQLGLAK